MKYGYIIAAALIASTPALACTSDWSCAQQDLNSRLPPPPESHGAEISNQISAATTAEADRIDDQRFAPSGGYQPRTCVTNYGGGSGVAITNCY